MSPTSYRAAPPRGVQRNIPDPERPVNTTAPRRRLSAKQSHRLAGLLARDGEVARVTGRGGLVHELGGLLALRALRGPAPARLPRPGCCAATGCLDSAGSGRPAGSEATGRPAGAGPGRPDSAGPARPGYVRTARPRRGATECPGSLVTGRPGCGRSPAGRWPSGPPWRTRPPHTAARPMPTAARASRDRSATRSRVRACSSSGRMRADGGRSRAPTGTIDAVRLTRATRLRALSGPTFRG